MERGRSDVPATVEYEQCGKPDGSNGRKPDEVGNSGEVRQADLAVGRDRQERGLIQSNENAKAIAPAIMPIAPIKACTLPVPIAASPVPGQ